MIGDIYKVHEQKFVKFMNSYRRKHPGVELQLFYFIFSPIGQYYGIRVVDKYIIKKSNLHKGTISGKKVWRREYITEIRKR